MVIIMDIYVFFVYTHVIVQVGFLEGSMAWWLRTETLEPYFLDSQPNSTSF